MTRQYWTHSEVETLTALYPSRRTDDVAKLLDRPIKQVYMKATALGLMKTVEFLDSVESGRLRKGQTRPGTEGTQFKKGQVPINKGLRRPGWSPGRMQETQFKKGCRSGLAAKNWKPVGTILTDNEGYLRIKVRESVYGKEATGFGNTNVWPLYGRYVWEQNKGPIPPKHVVAFIDHDRKNCAIENLELVSRGDLCRRNSMWVRLPRELAEVIQLNGALKRKLRRLGGQEQNQ